MPTSYLNDLNQAQKQAVTTTQGPLLVIAGAGAGKTKTITYRILHLITGGVSPKQILAITFTNKAAREMRERIYALLASTPEVRYGEEGPWIGTFHALGAYLLRENAQHINLPRHFTIADRDESLRMIREAMKREGFEPKELEPRKILGAISRRKGESLTAMDFEERVSSHYEQITARVWRAYEGILSETRALDFDDLLLKSVNLLRGDEDLRAHYGAQWEYVLVDEYQDTNNVQHELIELIAGTHGNICAVGDSDQLIYGWRGATVQKILSFEKVYAGAQRILLEQNYRSTKKILAAAHSVISKNTLRHEKRLFTENEPGESLALFGAAGENDEAQFVAAEAAMLIKKGIPPREIAVLFRTNFQSRVLEEYFLLAGVPYQVVGTRFFERKEVKDTLSYLRAALNPGSTPDIGRIINVPARGIGKVTLLKVLAGREQELSGTVRKNVEAFRGLLARIQETAAIKLPSETIAFTLKETGMEKMYKDSGTEEDLERLLNLRELIALAMRYDGEPPEEGLARLLEDAALASDQDTLIKNEQAVKLMTVHASKGLEFDVVFITGLEQGLFPLIKNSDMPREEQEEERRLMYVAITRARKKVFLSFAATRTVFGTRQVAVPSEFITDINEELLEVAEAPQVTDEDILF